MQEWLTDRKRNMMISSAVFCIGGLLLLYVVQPWLAFGISGLAAGVLSIPAIKKENKTPVKLTALILGESVGVALVAFLVFKLWT